MWFGDSCWYRHGDKVFPPLLRIPLQPRTQLRQISYRTFKQAEKLLKEVSTAEVPIERRLLLWSDIQQVSPESYRDTHNGTIEFMLKKNQAWPSNMEAFKKIGDLPLMSLMMKITCWGILQVIVQVLLTQVMTKVKIAKQEENQLRYYWDLVKSKAKFEE